MKTLEYRELFQMIAALRKRVGGSLSGMSGAAGSHATSHENGGADEINVGGLSGVLADPQTVATDPAGALDGNGSAGSPLAVRVDGVTIQVNGSNELETIVTASGVAVVGITIDGAGVDITTGVKGFIRVPFTGTISKITLLSTDASATAGSIVIDIWKDVFANYPPTVADTIINTGAGGTKPTLSTANNYEDPTLAHYTTSVTAGDVVGFKVDSCTGITRATLEIEVTL